jgi:hypothetical protein
MDFPAAACALHTWNHATLVDLNAAMQKVIADTEPIPGGGLIVIRSRTKQMPTVSETAVEIEIADTGHGTTLQLFLISTEGSHLAPPLRARSRVGGLV